MRENGNLEQNFLKGRPTNSVKPVNGGEKKQN